MWDELLGCLDDFADLVQLEGFADIAVRLSAAAAKARERLQLPRPPRAEERWQLQLASRRQAISGPVFEANWSDGRSWDVEDAIASALAMPPLEGGDVQALQPDGDLRQFQAGLQVAEGGPGVGGSPGGA